MTENKVSLEEQCIGAGLSGYREFLEVSQLPSATAYRWVDQKPVLLSLLVEAVAARKRKKALAEPGKCLLATPFLAVVDIETLAQSIDAVIATIGITVINVLTGIILGEFYVRVDHNQPGRVTDEPTLAFWAELKVSHPEAWAEVFDERLSRVSLSTALLGLKSFLATMAADGSREIEVMGNGPEFDNAIVLHAAKQLNMGDLWGFRRNQSMRTAVWLGRLLVGRDPKYQIRFEGVQHHALHDSRHEAKVTSVIVCDLAGC